MKFSGTVTVYDKDSGTIYVNTNWAKKGDSVSAKMEGDNLVIKKYYLEVPKGARTLDNRLCFRSREPIPRGSWYIDSSSDVDELVLYQKN